MIGIKVNFLSKLVVLSFLVSAYSYAQNNQSPSLFGTSRSLIGNIGDTGFTSPKSQLEREESQLHGGFPRIVLGKPVDPDTYMVGVGDQLVLLSFDKLKSEVLLTVGPEGKIILPDAGDLSVAGITLSEVRKKIISVMERQYPKIKFQLLLAQPRYFKVFVLGEINNPGVYTANALERVSDVVFRAGGNRPEGTQRKIEIRRGDRIINSDLYLFVKEGDLSANPYLLDNDIIFIPLASPRITLGGGVKNPGIYELEKGEDIAKLIKRTGGVTAQASLKEDIKIVRFTQRQRKETIRLNLGKVLDGQTGDFKLFDGDSIFVPSVGDTPLGETNIYISGEVKKPGAYPYEPGYTAKSYIGIAGGLTVRARLSQAEIIKADGRKEALREDTVLEIGDTINVPEKFIKVWQDCLVITTSISSLTLAVIAAFK